MDPAIKIAIAALVVSFLNIAFNAVSTTKTYRKSRRLEVLQRRDHLSQEISDLNDRNTEAHLISARFELVAVKNAGLALRGEQGDRNTALIASIQKLRDGVEKGIELWNENIEKLHFIYGNLTLESDALEIEKTIAIVRIASDDLKKANKAYSSVLHILEATNELLKAGLAETDETIRQINVDFEKAVAKLAIVEQPSNPPGA